MSQSQTPPEPAADGTGAAESPQPTATGATEGAARPQVPPVQILGQYVKDLSFENPNAPGSFRNNQTQPSFSINVDVRTTPMDGETTYEVTLTLRADARVGESHVFLVELSYAGLFALNRVPPDHHRPFLLIEAPRLLFPFARQIIAEITRDGGYPPLLINPIDFLELYRRQAGTEADAGSA